MNIWNNEERKVRCIRNDTNMTDSFYNHLLEVGKEYTIESIKVYTWSTEVFLKEFPEKYFNSVAFEEIEDLTPNNITPRVKKMTDSELHDMKIREETIHEFVKALKEEYKPVYESDTEMCKKVFNRFDKIAEQTLEKMWEESK